MRKIGLYVLLSILLIGGIAFSQNKAQAPQVATQQPAQEFPADNQEQTIWFNFDGKWMPDVDSSLIGPKNFKDLKNLRYTDASLEGVAGYTKLNSTALATYLKIRNGFHFKKDQPSESHVLVQAYNTGLTASKVWQNTTAIPTAGDFSATELHTDASGAGLGRFSQGPRGTVLYANGKESMVWGGSESQVGAFITSTAAITNSITNPRDFTSKITNTLQTEDQLALIGGGNDAATVLLLHTDGADASTTFTDSSATPHTLTAAGDAQIDVAQAVFGSGSGLFDGTGDYVTIPDNADFNLGTGTLTLDLRIRFNTVVGMQVLYMQKDATNGDHILLWQDHAEGKLHFQVTDTGASVINEVATWAPSAATWYHLALIRGWGGVADDWAITVNGTSIHTFTNAGTMPDHDQVVTIGGNLGNYALDYTARHLDIAVAGGADLSSTQAKYGSGSWHFDGTDDYLSIADHADYDIVNTANVTVDFWAMHADHVGTETYISQYVDAGNYWWLGHVHGTGIVFQVQTGGAAEEVNISGGEITDTNWHHIAMSKVGNAYGIYKDGIQIAYVSYAGTDTFAGGLYIGSALGAFEGYMEDIRITHANTFTAAPNVGLTDTIVIPTVPVSADANTKLLIRGDVTDFNGWLDEVRLKKASSAWTANFTIPVRAYSDNALYWTVGSTRPLQGLKTYIANANTETAATVTGTFWNGYSWTSLGTFVDNTSGLEVTGTMTWDSTVLTAKPKFLEGYFLYFYQFALSAGSADIYYVTVDAPFQPVGDIWDGVYRQAIAFQASRSAVYEDYTLEVNTESTVADPIAATIGGLTNTDHVIIMFDDRTTAIRWQMIAGKGNTTNATTTIYYWDGSAWVSVGSVVDLTLDSGATDTLNQTGVMSWTPPNIESEFQQELFGVTGYAYKIMFSATLLDGTDHDGTSVGIISGIPAQQKIKPYKFPSTYKNRVMLCGFTESNEGNRVDYSLTNAPDVYNGADSSEGGLQSLYFGGEEELTAATQLYNRFGSNIFATWLVFKNSETYLLTGDTPEDFKISPISFNVGCPAPLTLATAELGYEIANEAQRNVALWLSNTGPMMFDGAVFVPLRGVDKFFDATYSDSINQTYIANSRGWYDPLFREYNLLIPTGSAQVTCDTWLVYDLVRKKWYQKDTGVAAYPQAGFQVSDTTGKKYIYGAIDTGYMMRMEYGYTWNTTPITYVAEVGDFYPTGSQWDITRLRRVKLTSKMISEDVDVTVYHYEDTDDTTETAIATIPLDGVANRITRETPVINSVAWSHRLKFQASTSATSRGFSPTSWGVQYFIQRKDLATDMSFTDTPTLPHVGDSKSIYYVNYAATDQGVDANDQSLFDLCDSVIGTSKKAIVKFKKWRATGDTTDYTVTTNIDLSAYTNITFEFERGAELTGAGDIIFPSPSNIIAQPDQQIFSGTGTITFSKAGTGYPCWTGAIGDGSTDDSVAFQAIATSLPAGSTIDGAQLSYKINSARAQFTTLDLHYLGVDGNPSTFTSGYWYGVSFPTNIRITNCNFVVYSDGYTATVKNYSALAFGTSGSSPRHEDIELDHCSFKWLIGDAGTEDIRTMLFVGVDNIKVHHNTFDSSDSSQNMAEAQFFDCNDINVSHNFYNDNKRCIIMEFCNRTVYSHNQHWNCRYVMDADKRDIDVTVAHNTYNRATQDSGDDGVFEFNGTQGVVLVGNQITNAYRYAFFVGKSAVWDTWAMVLAQAGTSSYTPYGRISSKGNVIKDSYAQGFYASAWDDYTHDLVQCGEDIVVEDEYYNCASGLNSVASGVIQLSEGRRIKVNSIIKGGGACGVRLRSYVDAQYAGATTYSDLDAEIGGVIEDTNYCGIYIYQPGHIQLNNPTLRRCGESNNIAALIYLPETRNSITTGSIRIEEDTGTIEYGLRVYADDWTQGNWLIKLDNVYISGHNALKDVYMTDITGGAVGVDSANIWYSGYISNPQTYWTNNGARTYNGNPTNNVTPRYSGEMVWDYANSDWYLSIGTAAANWVNLTP